MSYPKVSVIIPAYNGAEHLGEAIQSVLDQTYKNFEIIIVDDASPEPLAEVIKKFSDPRVRYIRHEQNRGAVAARKTGVLNSSGDLIALLDQDDLFHREKLEVHAAYMQEHSQVGMTYNARFEMLDSMDQICDVWRPPQAVTLTDWVMSFPVSPSDTVLRREWALRDEIWDDSFAGQAEHIIFNGQEIVFGGRLALAGCKFGNVDRALNYRRYHARRMLAHLAERCRSELACQDMIFDDPRCPREVRALRKMAAAHIHVMWAYTAYIQGEFDLGRRLLSAVLQLEPTLNQGSPCEIVNRWVAWTAMGTMDQERDYRAALATIFDNLPEEFEGQKQYFKQSLAKGVLLKGLHQMIWDRRKEAQGFLLQARQLGARLDQESVEMLAGALLNYESEFGTASAHAVIADLQRQLERLGINGEGSHLRGNFSANHAFRDFQAGKFSTIPGHVLDAVRNNPAYLMNKGVLLVLLRSLAWRVGMYKPV